MRIVIQRVSEAKVTIDHEICGSIEHGFVVLLGITHEDTESDADYLIKKLVGLRVFADENGKMNVAINDVGGNVLLISQFTLFASYKKGNRPGFTKAAKPEQAIPLYEYFKKELNAQVLKPLQYGQFGADMKVSLVNDGPITIVMDSKSPE